ncbi:MAG: hypothetical protein EOM73_01095, partial [Bacteroidia bacterium]|nr:hypothetical protein [Bacteroidia bacterium]
MKNYTLLFITFLLSMVTMAQQATFNWEKTTLNPDKNLQKMAVLDNEAVIAGYGNSFFKSKDGGETWDTLNFFKPGFNFMGISIKGNTGYLVSNRPKLYDASPDVCAEGVIFKTTDGGSTWTCLDLANLGSGSDASVCPADTLVYGKDFLCIETINDTVAYCAVRWYEYGVDDHSGVFKTTDGGLTWTNISGDLEGGYVSSIVSDDDEIFIGGNKMLYRTTVTADTLANIFPLLNGSGLDYINDITVVNENEMYIITTSDSVYYSNDGGASFGQFGQLKGGNDIFKVNDSTLVVGGSSNKSYVSTNNGQTWKSLGIATSIWEVPGIINDSVYFLANAAIHKIAVADLIAGNYTFNIQAAGNNNLQKASILTDKIIIVGNSNTWLVSSNSGQSWKSVEMPEIPVLNAFCENINFNDLSQIGNEGYLCFNRILFVDYPTSSSSNDIYWSGGILYTSDNWETVKSVDVATIGADDAYKNDPSMNPYHASCNGVNTSCLAYLGNNVVLAWARWCDYSAAESTEHSRVFKSTDGGKKWTVVTDDLGKLNITAIKSKGDTVYMGGNTKLFKSVDAGTTFTNIYPNLDYGEDDAMFINAITLGEEGEVFIATVGDSIQMSVDGGNTFTVLGNVSGANDFYRFDDNSFIFMGTTGKSKFSNDGGASWQDCHPGVSIWETGGVYNNKFYALAKGDFYTVNIDALDLKTSVPVVKISNELVVRYKEASVELVSPEKKIDVCKVYSLSGKVVSVTEPAANRVEFQNQLFRPGVYI